MTVRAHVQRPKNDDNDDGFSTSTTNDDDIYSDSGRHTRLRVDRSACLSDASLFPTDNKQQTQQTNNAVITSTTSVIEPTERTHDASSASTPETSFLDDGENKIKQKKNCFVFFCFVSNQRV